MRIRSVLILLLTAVTGLFVARNAFVAAYAEKDPGRASELWADHPRVLVSQALTDIGAAAGRAQPPPSSAIRRINEAAALSPLGHDAFLVRGIQAQEQGDAALAERSFAAARMRAPREAAPRYFLSQLYLTSGRGQEGLSELATLARLLPNGPSSVAPSLAAYARASGDIASLKSTFARHPELEEAVLLELAKDPANAPIAVRLANRFRNQDGRAPDWATQMIPRLVDAGRFEEARGLWTRVSGVSQAGLLFDPGFSDGKAPPPFNWQLRSDSAGFAERDGQGGMHVLFYGREDAVLASQVMMLPPGRYHLSMRVAGNPAGMLRWTVSCLQSKAVLSTLPLGASASAAPTAEFVVPAGCAAQRIELAGTSADLPKQADVTVSGVSLSGGAGGR